MKNIHEVGHTANFWLFVKWITLCWCRYCRYISKCSSLIGKALIPVIRRVWVRAPSEAVSFLQKDFFQISHSIKTFSKWSLIRQKNSPFVTGTSQFPRTFCIMKYAWLWEFKVPSTASKDDKFFPLIKSSHLKFYMNIIYRAVGFQNVFWVWD